MKIQFMTVLITVLTIFGLTGCSKDDDKNGSENFKTYVIVPGAWSAPYAWQTVKTELESQGQKVVVVQLPGHGTDRSPFNSLHLDIYRDRVVDVIDSLHTKVILIGHSLGGMVITAVAEEIPSKIEKMIYVAAFLPVNKQSLLDLANTDTTSLLGRNITSSDQLITLDLPHDKIADIFLQDGSLAARSLLIANYRTEAGIPFADPVIITASNFGSVDKYYIHTILDQAVTFKLQKRMVAAAGLTKIYNLNTSHSPFLAKPDSLTILLRKIAQ